MQTLIYLPKHDKIWLMKLRTPIKLLIAVFVFLGTFNLYGGQVQAQEVDCSDICGSKGAYDACVYNEGGVGGLLYDSSIVRTTLAGAVASAGTTVEILTYGENPEQTYQDACVILDSLQANGSIPLAYIEKYKNSGKNQNSLAGLAYKMGNQLDRRDAIPVNLAYYFKTELSKLPYVGDTAYAQSRFSFLGADFVYILWKYMTKLAYGVISIAMLFTGILIMLRKQLPSKTAVTIQYAFPRLALSLVLITFSYPIGGFAVSLIPVLRDIGGEILKNAGQSFGMTGTGADFNTLAQTGALIKAASKMGVGGTPTFVGVVQSIHLGLISMFISLYVGVIWLLITIIAFGKSVVIQVQILGSVIFAPITFAWAAIPGNEKMINDWFKKLLARVLSIPAMYFLISLSTFVVRAAIKSSFVPEVTYDVGAAQESLLVMMFIPFISTMILISAITVSRKVESAIMGPPKR